MEITRNYEEKIGIKKYEILYDIEEHCKSCRYCSAMIDPEDFCDCGLADIVDEIAENMVKNNL